MAQWNQFYFGGFLVNIVVGKIVDNWGLLHILKKHMLLITFQFCPCANLAGGHTAIVEKIK